MASDDDWDNPWADDPSDESDWKDGNREVREETFGAHHVLILIDCRPSMFVPSISTNDGDTISPMQASLEICETLLRSKVKHVAFHKTGKRDGVGVMLYGIPDATETTKSLIALEPPGVEQIRTMGAHVEGERSLEKEFNLHDQTKKTSWTLRRALQDANSAMNQAKCVKRRTPSDKALPDGKSLWIFTNDDEPLKDEDEDGREKIEKAASDVIDNGIDIHVWPMKTPFCTDFYDSILTSPVQTQHDIFDMEELMDRIKREFRKQRVAFRCPLLFPDWRDRPDDPGIMIDFYSPIQIQKKPQAIIIHQKTKKPTEKVVNTMDTVTGETLYSSRDTKEEATARGTQDRLRSYTLFGGKSVPIQKQEVATIKQLSNADQDRASLILLGFKPKDSLPMHFTLAHSYYLYPNEEMVKGSSAAFANLHAAMIRKRVVAIGELLTRVTATSKLVAIYAQEEKPLAEGEGGDVELPQCMVAYTLPFEDDVRELEEDSGTASEESVQAAMRLIDVMTFGDDFSLDYFKNDSLLYFYAYMESVALETPLPTLERSLKPFSDDNVRETAGEQIDAFKATLPEDIVVPKEPKKRKREPDQSGCDWVNLYKMDEVGGCKMEQLGSYLKSVGEKVGGNKPALVERVTQSIGARIASGELKDA